MNRNFLKLIIRWEKNGHLFDTSDELENNTLNKRREQKKEISIELLK